MAKRSTHAYRFRVSDAVPVPLRGTMLRLKLLEGEPDLSALKAGSTIRLEGPGGETRSVEVKGLSVTGGRASQKLLRQYGQLDVLIPQAAGAAGFYGEGGTAGGYAAGVGGDSGARAAGARAAWARAAEPAGAAVGGPVQIGWYVVGG